MANKVRLEPVELRAIQRSLENLYSKIQEVSDGGYVTKNLFSESRGTSADTMNELLAALMECSKQMKNVIEKTDKYLDNIIEEFVSVDRTWAARLNLGDYLKGN